MGDPGSVPGLGRSPGEGNGNPLQWVLHSCLENSHGGKSLVGYSPQGRRESDTTELLHFTSNPQYQHKLTLEKVLKKKKGKKMLQLSTQPFDKKRKDRDLKEQKQMWVLTQVCFRACTAAMRSQSSYFIRQHIYF